MENKENNPPGELLQSLLCGEIIRTDFCQVRRDILRRIQDYREPCELSPEERDIVCQNPTLYAAFVRRQDVRRALRVWTGMETTLGPMFERHATEERTEVRAKLVFVQGVKQLFVDDPLYEPLEATADTFACLVTATNSADLWATAVEADGGGVDGIFYKDMSERVYACFIHLHNLIHTELRDPGSTINLKKVVGLAANTICAAYAKAEC